MKIRFKTKDGLECVKEVGIEEPLRVVMRPMRSNGPTPSGNQWKDFMEHRRYEFRGEVVDGIPTVHEVS